MRGKCEILTGGKGSKGRIWTLSGSFIQNEIVLVLNSESREKVTKFPKMCFKAHIFLRIVCKER